MMRWTDLAEWRGPTKNVGGPMVEQRGMAVHISETSYEGAIGLCINSRGKRQFRRTSSWPDWASTPGRAFDLAEQIIADNGDAVDLVAAALLDPAHAGMLFAALLH